jgi:hypothetical protein
MHPKPQTRRGKAAKYAACTETLASACTCRSVCCICVAGGSFGARFLLSRVQRSNISGGVPLKCSAAAAVRFAQLVQRTSHHRTAPQRTPGPRATRRRAPTTHRTRGAAREAVAAAARASRRAQDEVCSPPAALPVRWSHAGCALPTARAISMIAPTPNEWSLERR